MCFCARPSSTLRRPLPGLGSKYLAICLRQTDGIGACEKRSMLNGQCEDNDVVFKPAVVVHCADHYLI